MWIRVFVHACLCMGLEITIAFSWHLGSLNNMKIRWLKSLTFSLRTILKLFFIGGAQHMKHVPSHYTKSPFNKNCQSSYFLLMNQPLLYLHCSNLKDADLAWEDTSAVCFTDTIDCLSILALSPLTFVHSEISTLPNVRIAHDIPKSQVEQVEIEMRNMQDGILVFFEGQAGKRSSGAWGLRGWLE